MVSEVFKQVEAQGDHALLEYTAQFDQIQLQTVQVQAEEVTKAVAAVPEELKQAIQNAKTNIEAFHTRSANGSCGNRNPARCSLLARKKTH